jgi:hypothetical protein
VFVGLDAVFGVALVAAFGVVLRVIGLKMLSIESRLPARLEAVGVGVGSKLPWRSSCKRAAVSGSANTVATCALTASEAAAADDGAEMTAVEEGVWMVLGFLA